LGVGRGYALTRTCICILAAIIITASFASAQLAPGTSAPRPQQPAGAPSPQTVTPAARGPQPSLTPMTMPAPGTATQTAMPAAGTTGGASAAQPQAAARPVVNVVGGQVSLNFDDTDVYSVIHTIFGDVLRATYVIDPKVKGRVTFRSAAPIAKENILPIMEVILRLNGLGIVEEAGIYRIVPMGDVQREPTAINLGRDPKELKLKGTAILQVIPVRYVQSSDLVKIMTPLLTTSAIIVDVPKSNHIVVIDTDANVRRLLKLVEVFDSEQLKRKGPQVFVYHVQNGKAKDIAAQLQQIFLGSKSGSDRLSTKAAATAATSTIGQTAAATAVPGTSGIQTSEAIISDTTKIIADEILNAIIVLSTAEDYEIIKDAITKIDIVPRQVIIEGVIANIYLKNELSLGLAWSIKTNISDLGTTISLQPGLLNAASVPTSGLTFVGTDSGGAIRALIAALAADTKAKLMATPHILVSDNKEAQIQVGKQVPIVTGETYAQAGVIPQKTIQYKDIGIILKVKPQVNDGGLVNLQISQEVSTYSTIELTTGTKDIIIEKTSASTNLVVQDGHTIIIGGLIREDRNKTFTGIPWLRDIPFIGWLFGGTSDTVERTELVILLTPHVIKSLKDAKKSTSNYVDKFLDSGKGDFKKKDLLKDKEENQPPEIKKDDKKNLEKEFPEAKQFE